MADKVLLAELEAALTHFFCASIEDRSRRDSMEDAVKIYVREEVSQFTDEEVLDMFHTQENAFRLFFEHLVTKGKVRVRDAFRALDA
jgi:hypothetical protein